MYATVLGKKLKLYLDVTMYERHRATSFRNNDPNRTEMKIAKRKLL